MEKSVIDKIERIIDYQFKDKSILIRAFTHSSAVADRLESNERLEFLGDAILGHVICQRLYEKFEDFNEGELTKAKSMLVSRRSCAKIIKELGLIDYLKLGKGMIFSRAISGSLSAALLEAIIAAIFFDGGFELSRDFILRVFAPMISNVRAEQCHGNFKSLLQQYSQRKFNKTPSYVLLDEQGPDHNKCFEVQAVVGERRFEGAWGTNKKEAEQKAAFNALMELGLLEESEDFVHQE